MAFDYKRLVEVTTLPSSGAAIFTQPAAKKTYVRLIVLHNTNTTNEIVKLYSVPDSGGSVGTAADANKIFQDTLGPNETRHIEYPTPGLILLDENETIQGVTTTASKVTVFITGGQE